MMNENELFRNYSLTDDEVVEIINKYDHILNKYSRINGKVDEDLKQEIRIYWYKKLTKFREI